MKKHLFAILASLLLFGGIGSAQDEPLLDPVGLTADFELLAEIGEGEYTYQLIPDGNPEHVYKIHFSKETATDFNPEGLMEFGLCLDNAEEVFSRLKHYYESREPKELYLDYLLVSSAGDAPFVVVQIEPGEEAGDPSVVTLCAGAVLAVGGYCAPGRVPGDFPYGNYPVSPCAEGAAPPRPLAFTLVIGTDKDGDGVFDDVDACLESNLSPTVDIEGCDYGVENLLFDDGCTISDRIEICADEAANHGGFVSCVTHYTNELKRGLLSGAQKGLIQRCAAQSSTGIVPCSEPGCEEGDPSVVQNRHRARFELAENDLVIPCVEVGQGQYLAVDMDLVYASSKNFHFKVKKADKMSEMQINKIEAAEECAQYDLASNSLLFPKLAIGDNEYRVQLKLLGANSANFHFKLQSITEAAQ